MGVTLGTVEDIGLRATHIVTRDAVTMIIPNSALVTADVINHSRPTTHLRVRIAVGVAYGTDTGLVKELLLRVAGAAPSVLKDPPPDVRFEDSRRLRDAALLASLLDRERAREDLRVGSELRFMIATAFREAKSRDPVPAARSAHPLIAGVGRDGLTLRVRRGGVSRWRRGTP